MKIGSLFSGYGGLDLGVQLALGGDVTWHCDYDTCPSKVLAHHWPDIPNLVDVTKVDWASVEPVDVITGGSPCQDVSAAGKRAGMRAGTRSGLWASMCDAIDIIRPGLVVWENVRGAYSAGADSAVEPCPICLGDGERVHLRALGRVLGDLAELGYDAWWTGVRAADAGAPHSRFRVFVFAWPAAEDAHLTARRERGVAAPGQAEGGWSRADAGGRGGAPAANADGAGLVEHGGPVAAAAEHAAAEHGRNALAHAEGHGWDEGWPEPAGLLGRPDAALSGDAVPHSHGLGQQGFGWVQRGERDAHGRRGEEVAWGDYEPAIRRWESATGRPAPAPTEPGKTGQPRLSPAFVEWLMGLPDGHVTAVPGLTRNEQLKLLGNGVVPHQAALATRMFLDWRRKEVAA